MIDSLDWSLQLNNFDLYRHPQLIRQYVHVHTAHAHIDTHMCFFKPCHVKAKRSSYVSSSHSNCNNLTIFNGAYRLLPLLLHCTKQLHTNCTNAAPSIKHIAAYCSFFVRFFLSGLLKFFLMCNVLLFILKMQKNDMMICCFFWSAAHLDLFRRKKKYKLVGPDYIVILFCQGLILKHQYIKVDIF